VLFLKAGCRPTVNTTSYRRIDLITKSFHCTLAGHYESFSDIRNSQYSLDIGGRSEEETNKIRSNTAVTHISAPFGYLHLMIYRVTVEASHCR